MNAGLPGTTLILSACFFAEFVNPRSRVVCYKKGEGHDDDDEDGQTEEKRMQRSMVAGITTTKFPA